MCCFRSSGMQSKAAWLAVAAVLLIVFVIFLVFPLVMLLLFLFSLSRRTRCFVNCLSERPNGMVGSPQRRRIK